MIEVDRVTVKSGSFLLENVSLQAPSGAYGVLMGKTGCGKTTLLEAIIGLKPVTSGAITLCGTDVTHLKPALRGIGYVPQDRALFATMSVRDNLAFALTIRKWTREDIARRVGRLADLLGLAPLLDRGVRGLSGGESQRVALGRALAAHPGILCLDEPLSALDEETREEICDLLLTIRDEEAVTILHVTHNPSEALRLSDRIFRLRDGAIEQVPPSEIAPRLAGQKGGKPPETATKD